MGTDHRLLSLFQRSGGRRLVLTIKFDICVYVDNGLSNYVVVVVAILIMLSP